MSSLVDRVVAKLVISVLALSPRASARVVAKTIHSVPKDLILREALASLPIRSIVVEGAQGVFEGAAKDVSIIQKYALEQQWSPKMLRRLQHFFEAHQQKGTYVDVGANIGLVAIPIAASGVRVLAFEPVPTNYESLLRNAANNQVSDRLEALPVALLDRKGKVTFELSPSNHGDHRFRSSDTFARMGESNWETASVRAELLDSFADQITPPYVLKIDTQGAEPLVITGGSRVCKNAAMVICEFSPYAMTRMQTDPEVIINLFSDFKEVEIYECENEDSPKILAGASAATFLREYFRQNAQIPYRRYLNLVAQNH